MARKKGESLAGFESTQGSTLSRTLPPQLPPSYLSRRRLFSSFADQTPGSTLVLAPSGFGKTTLVADWASHQEEKVIWLTLTSNDSIFEMSAMLIQATRNVIPGFASWFESERPLGAVEVVRRWGNELFEIGEDFIFVLDSLRSYSLAEVSLAVKLVEQFPTNIQFISLRREASETLVTALQTRGPLSLITQEDLRFTREEIKSLAALNNIEIAAKEQSRAILAVNGWPAATSMILDYLSKNKKDIDFQKIIATESDPLRTLVLHSLEIVSPKEKLILTKLSAAQEFSHELANLILGAEYSYDLINQIAVKGNFFTQTSNPNQTFTFSHLIREVLLAELRKDPDEKRAIHSRIVGYFENQNQPSEVLEHAYLAGNFEKVSAIFPNAARVLQATGRGDELLRWAVYAGDTSEIGLLKRGTVELAGYLALMDIPGAQRCIENLKFKSQGTELEPFISQLTCRAQIYLDLAFGRLDSIAQLMPKALDDIQGLPDVGPSEKIAMLRIKSIRSFMLEEGEEVQAILDEAKSLSNFDSIENISIILSSMHAMALYEQGDFRRAYEAATMALHHSRKAGFVGILGPLEVLYVIGRCQIEFSQPDEALKTFYEIRTLSENWKQWSWYFIAEGFIARDLIYRKRLVEALEKIKLSREYATLIPGVETLTWITDLSEILVRFFMQDHNRLDILLDRVPNTRFVKQVRFSYYERIGKKNLEEDARKIPAKTPHEKMWKHLAEAGMNLGSESVAIREMKKALEIGAVIGAKETFLRQELELGNLIIKIAGENPTVYLEELATAVTTRIRMNAENDVSVSAILTRRELEVLRHLSTDRPISAIAATLHISLNTMKTHLKNLYRKMEVDGRVSAVEKAKAHFIL